MDIKENIRQFYIGLQITDVKVTEDSKYARLLVRLIFNNNSCLNLHFGKQFNELNKLVEKEMVEKNSKVRKDKGG